MIDQSQLEYIPFGFKVHAPSGTVEGFDMDEILFDKELSEEEQEGVNEVFGIELCDWRDAQTLWVWNSTEELSRWLEYLDNKFKGGLE
jgi:hypothetical protein